MKLSFTALAVLSLWLGQTMAQSVSLTASSDLTFVEGTRTKSVNRQTGPPTGPYATYSTKITLSRTSTNTSGTESNTLSSTFTGEIPYTTTTTIAGNLTETRTSTTAQPTNTQPCNNHIELCKRKYSNVTFVAAHNSPFVRPGNSGSNQELDVKTQLNDGIRFLQAQIQWPNNASVPHFCHTSCDLLDAGPITDWLTKVRQWVDNHPYDVVTILLGNGNYSKPAMYAPYIESTGILRYAYTPPYLPMALNDWPTLEDMIIRGKRVVMFLDYMADQVEYPWLLDEFSQVWESPFDPVDQAFPCTVQRPPDLAADSAKDRLYLINHNLNAEFNVFGTDLLVPAVSLLNVTNNVTGYGSLGLAANNCRSDWGRPPNFLNVDYYNYGGFPGSVFEVAAQMNNVSYDRNSCCGTTSGAPRLGQAASWTALFAVLFSVGLVL
ncbi:Fc.00g098430.m01.CDS01 [Cosmosporella sp. VM-42]